MRKRYDLDLLRSLQVLIEEEGVSHAARRLKVSEAAMSRSLAKLRVIFGDPILVASGRRMVATTFALGLRDRVRTLVDGADACWRSRRHRILPVFPPISCCAPMT